MRRFAGLLVVLALILALYRRGKTLDASRWQDLREVGVPPTLDTEPLPTVTAPEDPRLPPAGRRPAPTAEEAARV